MTKLRRNKRFPPFFRRQNAVTRLPGLEILDKFSSSDLAVWTERSKDLDELHNLVYIGPEAERRRYATEIEAALREPPPLDVDLGNWVRMVKARYANAPLSCAGSLLIGGRFNIGVDADQRIREIFPALYLADSAEIAYREFYQVPAVRYTSNGLTPEDLSLGVSSATFFVRGQLSNVFDATSLDALAPVAKILSAISMPDEAKKLLEKLGSPGGLKMVGNAADLRNELHSHIWRAWPSQFGVPSASQQFAQLVHDAGFSGIFYSSTKADGHCLAVFPKNIFDLGSRIELRDPCAASVTPTFLSAENAEVCFGYEHIPTSERRSAREVVQ